MMGPLKTNEDKLLSAEEKNILSIIVYSNLMVTTKYMFRAKAQKRETEQIILENYQP